MVGIPSGMPVSVCTGSPTPTFAAHPVWRQDARFFNCILEAIMVKRPPTPAATSPATTNSITAQYGELSIKHGSAADHAAMIGAQLSSLLLLMHGEDSESFRACNPEAQTNLLWLVSNLASELSAAIPLVAAESRLRGTA